MLLHLCEFLFSYGHFPTRPLLFYLCILLSSLVFPLPPEAREKRTATEVGDDGVVRKKWTEARLRLQEELETMFVDVATQCTAVVCCRVSPLQKAQVCLLLLLHCSVFDFALPFLSVALLFPMFYFPLLILLKLSSFYWLSSTFFSLSHTDLCVCVCVCMYV